MSEKITLTRYLKGRGEVKALTHIEALAFGVPYPLQPGWPAKYGATEITEGMIEDLKSRIATAKGSTASKAMRGLAGLEDGGATQPAECATQCSEVLRPGAAATAERVSPVPGFVLRQAKRYRGRKSAPWA